MCAAESETITLAHLTDPHLTLAGLPPGWRDLPLKRALSRLSWHSNRHRVHRPEALRSVVADMLSTAPDQIAVTGDLTNLALPAEFKRASAWLAGLGGPDIVSVVPGNHDAMVRGDWATGIGRWTAYLAGVSSGSPAPPFPYLRRRGPLALIGLSSAVPSPPFRATGLVGADQAARLAALLDEAREAGLCRVVLLHHPPLDGIVHEHKLLLDRLPIRALLATHGAELVLCGHSHIASLDHIAGPGSPIPVLIGPSASAAPGSARGGGDAGLRAAGWHHIRVEKLASSWRLAIRRRQLAPDGSMHDTFEALIDRPR